MEEIKINWHDIIPQYRTVKLKENEVLCDKCHGAALVLQGNMLISCNNCRSGIQMVCNHCGERLKGYSTQCKCKGAEWERRTAIRQKELDRWNKAEKITIEEAVKRGIEMVFDEDNEKYYEIDCLEEELEEFWADQEYDNPEYEKQIPLIYGTYSAEIHIDADHIVEQACDDLHEEAGDNIGQEDINELQTLLDEWCKKQTRTKTYYQDCKVGIIVEI